LTSSVSILYPVSLFTTYARQIIYLMYLMSNDIDYQGPVSD